VASTAEELGRGCAAHERLRNPTLGRAKLPEPALQGLLTLQINHQNQVCFNFRQLGAAAVPSIMHI